MSYLEAFLNYYASKRYRRNSFPLTSKQTKLLDYFFNQEPLQLQPLALGRG